MTATRLYGPACVRGLVFLCVRHLRSSIACKTRASPRGRSTRQQHPILRSSGQTGPTTAK